MGVMIGRHEPAYQPVSIAHIKTVRQIRFDGPDDMLHYLERHPDMYQQIEDGEWVWTTQEIGGGS